ncbi:hypothetical protein KUTeg_014622 [Tegillarca granosa]|uniref:C2H2-type domain-containing protein n=1 Tax=Tegillarca granosa TaxID=220873 RepID=A0ABQ9ERH9_TEGGR|nr:hypothetical protein KUTeg_014622 [Tegillarca granosa]
MRLSTSAPSTSTQRVSSRSTIRTQPTSRRVTRSTSALTDRPAQTPTVLPTRPPRTAQSTCQPIRPSTSAPDDDDEPVTTCFWCLQTFTDEHELKKHEKCHDMDEQSSPIKRRRRHSISLDDFSPIAGPSSTNQLGTRNDRLTYTIKQVGEKKFKNAAIDRHYKVQFHANEALQGGKLSDLHDELQGMFDELLNEVKLGLQGNDLGRVVISHPKLTSNIIVPLQKLDELSGAKVMEYVENVLNSHEHLALEDEMTIDVGTIEIPKGGYGIQINNIQDSLCLARAILMGCLKIRQMDTKDWKDMISGDSHLTLEELVLKYKACPKWFYRDLNKEKFAHRQTEIVHKVCEEINVCTLLHLGLNDIPPFEQFFEVDVLVNANAIGFVKSVQGVRIVTTVSVANISTRPT